MRLLDYMYKTGKQFHSQKRYTLCKALFIETIISCQANIVS